MSWLETLVEAQWARQLGWVFVHFLWQGALVGGGAALALCAMRRASPGARYVACGVGLVAMLAAPFATWAFLAQGGAAAVGGDPVALTPAAAGRATGFELWLPALALFWLVGAALAQVEVFRLWTGSIRVRSLGTSPVPARVEKMALELCGHMRIPFAVRVRESLRVQVPTVVGWLSPVVLLPACALTRLGPDQLRAVLAHELAHVKRFDFLVNLFQALVESILFFHPAVWWLSRRMRTEREYCCDDLAVEACGDALRYARALSSLESLRGEAEPSLAMALDGVSLMQRIQRLVGLDAPPRRRSRFAPGLLTLIVAGSLGATAFGLSSSAPEPAQSRRVQQAQDDEAAELARQVDELARRVEVLRARLRELQGGGEAVEERPTRRSAVGRGTRPTPGSTPSGLTAPAPPSASGGGSMGRPSVGRGGAPGAGAEAAPEPGMSFGGRRSAASRRGSAGGGFGSTPEAAPERESSSSGFGGRRSTTTRRGGSGGGFRSAPEASPEPESPSRGLGGSRSTPSRRGASSGGGVPSRRSSVGRSNAGSGPAGAGAGAPEAGSGRAGGGFGGADAGSRAGRGGSRATRRSTGAGRGGLAPEPSTEPQPDSPRRRRGGRGGLPTPVDVPPEPEPPSAPMRRRFPAGRSFPPASDPEPSQAPAGAGSPRRLFVGGGTGSSPMAPPTPGAPSAGFFTPGKSAVDEPSSGYFFPMKPDAPSSNPFKPDASCETAPGAGPFSSGTPKAPTPGASPFAPANTGAPAPGTGFFTPDASTATPPGTGFFAPDAPTAKPPSTGFFTPDAPAAKPPSTGFFIPDAPAAKPPSTGFFTPGVPAESAPSSGLFVPRSPRAGGPVPGVAAPKTPPNPAGSPATPGSCKKPSGTEKAPSKGSPVVSAGPGR